MCSAPSSSMISVPDAALLPSTPRPVRRANSAMIVRREAVAETSGTARSSTMPIISQWPVTESLPGRRFRHAADGRQRRRSVGGGSPIARRGASPSERSVGSCSGTCARDVAERVAALIAVGGGVGQLADADAVQDDDDDAAKNVARLLMREVVGHRLRRLDRGDRVLEDHVIGAAVIEDHARSDRSS